MPGLIARPVTPHILRHTFAVTAVQKGISLPALQRLLGHEYLGTTQIYLNCESAPGLTRNRRPTVPRLDCLKIEPESDVGGFRPGQASAPIGVKIRRRFTRPITESSYPAARSSASSARKLGLLGFSQSSRLIRAGVVVAVGLLRRLGTFPIALGV